MKTEKLDNQIIESVIDSVDEQFFQELLNYRDEHLEVCQKSEKEYGHSQFNFLLVLAFTILSAFPISPIHWIAFTAGLIMLYITNHKRVDCKNDYNVNYNLHLISEEAIKRGRETLYGIS